MVFATVTLLHYHTLLDSSLVCIINSQDGFHLMVAGNNLVFLNDHLV